MTKHKNKKHKNPFPQKYQNPSKTLKGDTPYKLWYGKDPNIGYFKVFGCEAYIWNDSKTKSKFEPRGIKGIFLLRSGSVLGP